MTDVPALRNGLALLRHLAARPGPQSAATLARELGLPRSTTYHLLAELAAAGFVTHLPEERRYGLGVASFELGSAYLRHEPLERLARPLLQALVDSTGRTAHLGVLHGPETLYLLKEQPRRPQTLVTDIGVRLPAPLTAAGRALLGHLPAPQVRALFPRASAFVDRTGRGPRTLAALRRLLAAEREWSVEDGHVTPGFASVAAASFDHGGRPVAAISVTFRHQCETEGRGARTAAGPGECGERWPDLAAEVCHAAAQLTTRIGGRSPLGD
ncbi:IclR family transcriptional regulator [Longispora urticae]